RVSAIADAVHQQQGKARQRGRRDDGGRTLERDAMCANQPDRFVREPERRQITGLATSTWYELQNAGLAPKPFPLTARAVGWSFNELTAWVEARKNGRPDNWQQLGDVATCVVTKSRAR